VSASAATVLEPLLALDLMAWHGLPQLPVAALDAAFGAPERAEDARLGWYPARRRTYRLDRPSGGLDCYTREDHAVLIETLVAPPASALEQLSEPSAVKPHEILIDGAYVHEYVYAPRGLVLSVAEPMFSADASRIVRCRGVRPLPHPDDFGPEFYVPFEDQTVWGP
jgi:hypothetical protein